MSMLGDIDLNKIYIDLDKVTVKHAWDNFTAFSFYKTLLVCE
jgi:hypothetical protein